MSNEGLYFIEISEPTSRIVQNILNLNYNVIGLPFVSSIPGEDEEVPQIFLIDIATCKSPTWITSPTIFTALTEHPTVEKIWFRRFIDLSNSLTSFKNVIAKYILKNFLNGQAPNVSLETHLSNVYTGRWNPESSFQFINDFSFEEAEEVFRKEDSPKREENWFETFSKVVSSYKHLTFGEDKISHKIQHIFQEFYTDGVIHPDVWRKFLIDVCDGDESAVPKTMIVLSSEILEKLEKIIQQWIRASNTNSTALIPLNSIIATMKKVNPQTSLELMNGNTSYPALLLICDKDKDQLYIPNAGDNLMMSLSCPDLSLLDKEQVMEILEMLHTEEFLNDSRYDEIRNACSEKIKSY
jgi:hypothetical protein